MAGVWDGLRVLDLTRGIAGPIVTMLMADNGATVTRIEPPHGDPMWDFSGYRVWQHGKQARLWTCVMERRESASTRSHSRPTWSLSRSPRGRPIASGSTTQR